jgi:hypothetical protein
MFTKRILANCDITRFKPYPGIAAIEKDTMEWSIDKNEILSLKDSSGKTFTYKRFDE